MEYPDMLKYIIWYTRQIKPKYNKTQNDNIYLAATLLLMPVFGSIFDGISNEMWRFGDYDIIIIAEFRKEPKFVYMPIAER
jgi:hypothetical protein